MFFLNVHSSRRLKRACIPIYDVKELAIVDLEHSIILFSNNA